MKLPWQRPRPPGQAGTRPVTVTVAHSIQDPLPMRLQAIDGGGRARRLRARIGGSEIRPVLTPLANPLRHRAVEGCAGPGGQAALALRKLPSGRRLIHGPGPVEHGAAQGGTAPLLNLEERGQKAERTRVSWGKSRRQASRVAVKPSGQPARGWYSAKTAVAAATNAPYASSKLSRVAACATLGPSTQPLPTVVGTTTSSPASPVIFSSATKSCGMLSGLLTVVPTSCGRPKLSHARYQHSAARPKTYAKASQGTPPWRQ